MNALLKSAHVSKYMNRSIWQMVRLLARYLGSIQTIVDWFRDEWQWRSSWVSSASRLITRPITVEIYDTHGLWVKQNSTVFFPDGNNGWFQIDHFKLATIIYFVTSVFFRIPLTKLLNKANGDGFYWKLPSGYWRLKLSISCNSIERTNAVSSLWCPLPLNCMSASMVGNLIRILLIQVTSSARHNDPRLAQYNSRCSEFLMESGILRKDWIPLPTPCGATSIYLLLMR